MTHDKLCFALADRRTVDALRLVLALCSKASSHKEEIA